jgi:uracil-DNA glycosylase family 4
MKPEDTWNSLQEEIVRCNRCLRLRGHCEKVAREKRAAYRDEEYWGKPVPDFGSPRGRLLIVGLAPGAHGANRTGRMFTGDRSGDFLYRALHETGFANQAESVRRGDGLELAGCAITAAARCAPPGNRPTTEEIGNCFEYFERTASAMPDLVGVVALGGIAYRACLRLYRKKGWLEGKAPSFGHGAHFTPPGAPFLIASYHPSQQNTFTGRLTREMLRHVFEEASRRISGSKEPTTGIALETSDRRTARRKPKSRRPER